MIIQKHWRGRGAEVVYFTSVAQLRGWPTSAAGASEQSPAIAGEGQPAADLASGEAASSVSPLPPCHRR